MFSPYNRDTTPAHELATSIVFESGWQHLGDNPESYEAASLSVAMLERGGFASVVCPYTTGLTTCGPDTGSVLRGQASGRCVDVPFNSQTNRTRVELFDCNGGAHQQWNVNADGPSSASPPASAWTRPARRRPTGPCCKSGPATAAATRGGRGPDTPDSSNAVGEGSDAAE